MVAYGIAKARAMANRTDWNEKTLAFSLEMWYDIKAFEICAESGRKSGGANDPHGFRVRLMPAERPMGIGGSAERH